MSSTSEYTDLSDSSNSSDDFYDNQDENLALKGDILNSYNIITELGRGGYSIVWLGYNINDCKYYAIKVQHPDEVEEGKHELSIVKYLKPNNYVTDLKHYFKEVVDDDTYYCFVYDVFCANFDTILRKGKFNNGLPENTVKKIIKQLCLAVNYLHNEKKVLHGDIKPDNILFKGLNNRVKKYIELYDKAKFSELYTTYKKLYWEKKGKNLNKINKMKSAEKLKIRKAVHEHIIDKMEPNDEDSEYFDLSYLENIQIALTDFGSYCPDDEMYEEEFGTRYYQAPEIILMGNCTNKVDIWAIGCTAYELLTGKILFDPHKNELGDTNYNHLLMMRELCGEFDLHFLQNTNNFRKYFTNKGKIKDANIRNRELKDLSPELSSIAQEFISLCLHLKPSRRPNVSTLLTHEWLS